MVFLCLALQVYMFILFARILLSWVTMVWSPPSSLAPVVKVVYDVTEPVMAPLRRMIPPLGGLDLSPIFLFIAIRILLGVVCRA